MEKSLFRISLDIHRQTTQEHLAVKKGDTARCIIITLTDGGLPYAIGDGCYAVLMGKKPDGNVLYNACTIENGQIIYDFTEQTVSMVGRMPCEVRLYGADDALITSPRIAIIVSGTVYDDSEVESTAEFTALSEAMTELLELKEQNEEFTVAITGNDTDGYTADNDVYDIISADGKRQECVCHWGAVKLPLVRLENEVAYFAAVVDGIEYRVEIGSDSVVAVCEELCGNVFDIIVTGNDADGYTADKTYEEIRAAEAEGRILRCLYGTKVLSLVYSSEIYVTFGCVVNDVSHRVVIDAEQVKVFQTNLSEQTLVGQVTLTDGTYSLVDCTYADLLAAVEAGRDVQLCFYTSETFKRYYSLSHKRVTDETGQLIFSLNHSTSMEYIIVNKDGTVTRSQGTLVSSARKINGYALSADINLTAKDVGALSVDDTQEIIDAVLEALPAAEGVSY